MPKNYGQLVKAQKPPSGHVRTNLKADPESPNFGRFLHYKFIFLAFPEDGLMSNSKKKKKKKNFFFFFFGNFFF